MRFAPSFLTVGGDYFADRDAGFGAMDRSCRKINDHYVRAVTVGPSDPIEKVARQAAIEKAVNSFVLQQLNESPEATLAVIAQYQIPEPEPVSQTVSATSI